MHLIARAVDIFYVEWSMLSEAAKSYLEIVKQTGIEIGEDAGSLVWKGPKIGAIKDTGPLGGKRIGCLVASEFSDFQAYYIAAFIGELGGDLEFLLVDRVTWHWTRPNDRKKGVQGMWGLSVDPIPVGGGAKASKAKSAYDAKPTEYDAIIILGGPSGDMMSTEPEIQKLLINAYSNGAVVGGIGGGIIPLITVGLTNGKQCTGNEQVDFILKKTAKFIDLPCVTDQRVITAKDTIDTPEFVSALCRAMQPSYVDRRKGVLAGKSMMLIAGWDFEDFELSVTFLELFHRGASITIGTFTGCKRNRPGLLSPDFVQGNFGMTVPLQEIPLELYRIKDLKDISHDEYDALMIPGAFCPWNMIEAKYPIAFLKKANDAGRTIAFMCHGPIAVAAADIVRNRKSTGWLSSNPAYSAMGGEFCAEWAATIDGNLVSGKTTPEMAEFMDAITVALLNRQG